MDQATHSKTFNRSVCEGQPSRTLAECTALVSDGLVRAKLPVAHAPSSKRIVVTVSQEFAASLGAGCNGHSPTRPARSVWWMPPAIEHLQGGCAVRIRQMFVTVLRVLTLRQSPGLNSVEIARDGHEVGLAAGQA